MLPMQVGNGPTIRALLERLAQEQPSHVFCRFRGAEHTIAQIDARANQLANALTAQGLQPGDRVAVMLDHHPDHVAVVFGLAKAGFVRVSINPHFKGAALDHMLAHAAPHALIVERGREAMASPSLASAPVKRVLWREGADDTERAGSLERLIADAPDTPPAHRPHWDDILAINYTSGTTGAPKGAMRSDKQLRAGPVAYRPLADMRPGDVFLNWEPICHAGGFAILIAALMVPTTLDMQERFSASQYWPQIRAAKATQIHFIGGILPILLKQPPSPDDTDHRVRVAWGGGCPVDVWRPFENRFGVRMHEGYGISEIANFITINIDGVVGSVGKPLPYYAVRLCDDEGKDVAAGEAGEIAVRALEEGLAFKGYFRDPAATARAMRGDWFLTGDLGRFDADGRLYFIGRKKDSVRRRGVNISAWEVERIVGEHEAILESALIGVPSGLGDDDLKLFVKLRPGARLAPLDLVQWCEPRMPYFQIPRYIAFVGDFPKTPSERIRKGELPPSTDDCFDLEQSGYKIDRKKAG